MTDVRIEQENIKKENCYTMAHQYVQSSARMTGTNAYVWRMEKPDADNEGRPRKAGTAAHAQPLTAPGGTGRAGLNHEQVPALSASDPRNDQRTCCSLAETRLPHWGQTVQTGCGRS